MTTANQDGPHPNDMGRGDSENAASCEVRCFHPKDVAHARAGLPAEHIVQASAELFKLLGDAGRLRLLLALGGGELCVCDLAAVTGASESSVSHSLRLLRAARAVQARKKGRRVYYRLDDEHVAGLLHLMTTHMAHAEAEAEAGAETAAEAEMEAQ